MADLALVERLAAADHYLAVMAIARPDGSVHASVVSAGVIDDPVDGASGVAAVVGGNARKLELLRATGRATLVFKSGFEWVAVSGPVRLIGPDDGVELGHDVPTTVRLGVPAPPGAPMRTGRNSTASWRPTGAAPSSYGPNASRPTADPRRRPDLRPGPVPTRRRLFRGDRRGATRSSPE